MNFYDIVYRFIPISESIQGEVNLSKKLYEYTILIYLCPNNGNNRISSYKKCNLLLFGGSIRISNCDLVTIPNEYRCQWSHPDPHFRFCTDGTICQPWFFICDHTFVSLFQKQGKRSSWFFILRNPHFPCWFFNLLARIFSF